MDFEELVERRRSVRGYKPDPVADGSLVRVLEACRKAPTAANRQPFQIIVIHTSGKQEALLSIYERGWFVQAPLVLCLCGIPSEAWVHRSGKNYCDVDVAIVMDHLTLAAAGLGLGTCWVANFDLATAREFLGLPVDVEPIAFTPLGYAADEPRPKKRKSLEELVRYEHW